ncbi:MAG TPA: hypothetical protein DDZ96_00915 [Porphyromonadaceae bacterium]|jgi:glycosyltransferase involved in cell wall biosynthesis|nr:hypothetical protein [Porphyromonadaceae bacterium]HBX18960.1 hypothetical protein [Porphyromonadaceae bacterium]
MKVLVLYSRDIDIDDSGGSRTTIELMNYLANKGVICYSNFMIIKGGDKRIIMRPELKLNHKLLNDLILKEKIDILLIPEGYCLTEIGYNACLNTACKIISALHSKPGYEKQRLWVEILESAKYNDSKLKKIRALLALILYPAVNYYYIRDFRKKMSKAYEYSNKLVLLSENFYSTFIANYNIKDNGKKLTAIGNPLSFDSFFNINDIKLKKKQILVVARFDERAKRISLILKTWELLQDLYLDWSLEIVGFGRSLPRYLKMEKKLGLKRITFHGKQNPYIYYKEASIFLMTSSYEGWGMTITEAQQQGCVPVVMNTFESLSEIITDGVNGFCVEDNNLEQFVNRISQLINDDILRVNMAAKSVELSGRFSKDIILKKYYDLFVNLINEE